MTLMTSPCVSKNISGASHHPRRNGPLAKFMRCLFEEEQSCTSDKTQRKEVADKQQQRQTRKRSHEEICDGITHDNIALCHHQEGCDCGRIDASLFANVSPQELDKWLGDLVTATEDGHRESNKFNGKEESKESSSPSLVGDHQQRREHVFAGKKSKPETNISPHQDISTHICGGINAQVVHHYPLNDSWEPLTITSAENNTMALSSQSFQQQQTKRSNTEIIIHKQAKVICQDRAQQNGRLSISAHGAQCSKMPHLDAKEFTRDDLEVLSFQAARFEVGPADMQAKIRCQNQLHYAGQQEQQHGNLNNSLSNHFGGIAMTEGGPKFWGQKDLGISIDCLSITGVAIGVRITQLLICMRSSRESQQTLHDWDKSMGLQKCHSKTMRATSQSRKRLRKTLESLGLDLVRIEHRAKMA